VGGERKTIAVLMKRERISKNKLPAITAIHFRFIKPLHKNLLSK